MNFHDFSAMEADLEVAQTFANEFSGSSRVENLNQYDQISVWTRGKSNLTVESRARTEKQIQTYIYLPAVIFADVPGR